MTSLEALELGEMELIVSQSNADKKHMEIQMKALLVEVDELKESIETMQIVLDETCANNSKQKAKTRAVAQVAVKKQKTNKAEVVRLRESIDLIRKEWTSPDTFKALQSSFDKSKKKIKSLKYEIASTKKEIKNIKEMNDPENQTTTNTTTNTTTTNNTTNNNTESETKSSSSSSGSKLNAEEMLVEIKKYKLKIKKMNVESKRISVSMKELRNVHNKDMKVKRLLEEDLKHTKIKLKDAQKSHLQRKTAIDALREGVTAQRHRVEQLQQKVLESERLENRLRSAENERNRLSSELSEAHARYCKK